jgi:hypothetical protein
MKRKEIKQIVLGLNRDRDYFYLESRGKARRRRELSLAECLAMADSDPSFLWNLSVSDALAGRSLPSFVCSSAALRANCFYLYPEHPDTAIAVVASLGLPRVKPRRNLLRALSCCLDISFEGIAQECGLEVDEVRLFNELCLNFRDRVGDKLYVAQLLYPETRFGLEAVDMGLQLCRLGYERGYSAVLQAAGPDRLEESPTQAAEGAGGIADALVARSRLAFYMGLRGKESNPELELARQLKLLTVVESRRSTDDLTAMSMGRAINESCMRIMKPDIDRRLAAQLGLMPERPQAAGTRTEPERSEENPRTT